MKKFLKLLSLTLCFLLAGCNIPQTPKSKLVTGLSVEVMQDSQHLHRRYTDPQKMETVLSYLRAMDGPTTERADPERYAGPKYRMELLYSDGSKSYIFQHGDRFLSRDFHPWQELDPKYAQFLLPLIKNMGSD